MQGAARVLKLIVCVGGMTGGVFGGASAARAGDVPPPLPPAAFVLEVDLTDPANAIIRSAGGVSQVTGGGQGFAVVLDGFFSQAANFSTFVPVTLAPTLGGGLNFAVGLDGGSTAGRLVMNGGGDRTQVFVQGTMAFTGSVTIPAFNLLGVPSPVGTIGDVFIHNNFGQSTGQIIGQYRIVPAPGTAAAALALLGLTGATHRRRRR